MAAHAEKCPVCNGSGKVGDWLYHIDPSVPTFAMSNTNLIPCRSCGGKGWVTVQDVLQPKPIVTFGFPTTTGVITHDGITHA